MAYELRELSGSLFPNDYKSSDKQPDKKGKCLIEGVEYRMSVWTYTSKSGSEYESVSFTRSDQVPATKTRHKEEEQDEGLPQFDDFQGR
jgi:hypothetical protein